MSGWNLIIDVARCENCNNCVLANKDEYVGNDFANYSAPQALHGPSTIRIERRVRGEGHLVDAAYLPRMCNHCDDAPCIKAAGKDVIGKRPDGVVIIDPVKAKGRKDLVDACPYGAIVWNEEQQLPQNWIFDAHLLDQGWQEPRCAHSCPTDAIKAVKTDAPSMARMVREQKLEVLKPELKTLPRVYYRNLHRFSKNFVGGSVVVSINGTRECLDGATVTLLMNERVLQETVTDTFGDFKFDGLETGAGQYLVRVVHPVFGMTSIEAAADRTCVLGEIELPSFTGQPPRRPGRRRNESDDLHKTAKDVEPVVVATGAGSAV
jgi:Fe-S-cluster-containing dehydrogenase component